MKKLYVGVDIGGSSVKLGFFDEKKMLLKKTSIETLKFKKNNEKNLIKYILDFVIEFVNENIKNYSAKDICGIGFAVPGPVVKNQVIHAVNIGWEHKYDIVKAVKDRIGKNVNVYVGNDANVAAMAEYDKTLKKKYKSICLLTLGTGIGGGIIIDGELIEGRTGICGEMSHLKVDNEKDAIKCRCGNTGCLETVASGLGIARTYNRMYKTDIAKGAKDVIMLAKKGDKKAIKSLDKSLSYLSQIIIILMHVYEPEVILIGGGVSNAGTFITDIISKHIKEGVYMTKVLPKVMLAKLKNDAGIYGAIIKL